MSVIKPENVPDANIFPCAKVSGFGQSSFDTYDMFCNGEEYITLKCVAETTPGQSDHTAH